MVVVQILCRSALAAPATVLCGDSDLDVLGDGPGVALPSGAGCLAPTAAIRPQPAVRRDQAATQTVASIRLERAATLAEG